MSPLRVLQAVGTLDRGGVETWLLHVLRRVDRRDIEIDFLVHGAASGALTQEAVELGAEVLRIGGHRRPGYGRRLERLLRENRYDILHSHLHFFGGRILRTAARAGVPVRIAH
ncbi:MAG: glycosyltransferase, partial [Gemmatimonadetes bacterium]|nr:glycosyltransferase [Gemmatimonadota bacterium]